MSFECNSCHRVATGQSGSDVHGARGSFGPCETCKQRRQCFICHCAGDWAAARRAAATQPPIRQTRYTMWQSEAANPLGAAIAEIMAEGHYDTTYSEGPEFHYAITAAIRSRTVEEALRQLVDTFAKLQDKTSQLMQAAIQLAKIAPADLTYVVNKIDKPGST